MPREQGAGSPFDRVRCQTTISRNRPSSKPPRCAPTTVTVARFVASPGTTRPEISMVSLARDRFDIVSRDGGDQRDAIPNLNAAAARTVEIRMEEEAARGMDIHGRGDYAHFLPGHFLQLERHFDGDGKYLLTRVEHQATQGGLRSGEEATFSYENRFHCLPVGLPYRPPRLTPKPTIPGTQTAMAGRPGRQRDLSRQVWPRQGAVPRDRHGKKSVGSSCWRAQVWAGQGLGRSASGRTAGGCRLLHRRRSDRLWWWEAFTTTPRNCRQTCPKMPPSVASPRISQSGETRGCRGPSQLSFTVACLSAIVRGGRVRAALDTL